jgi:hypothetical protein
VKNADGAEENMAVFFGFLLLFSGGAVKYGFAYVKFS